MDTVQLLACAVSLVLFIVASVAIWNTAYPDTLTQRLGLVITDLGAIFTFHASVTGNSLVNSMLWTLVGVAIFAVGTLIKRVRAHRLGKVVL